MEAEYRLGLFGDVWGQGADLGQHAQNLNNYIGETTDAEGGAAVDTAEI